MSERNHARDKSNTPEINACQNATQKPANRRWSLQAVLTVVAIAVRRIALLNPLSRKARVVHTYHFSSRSFVVWQSSILLRNKESRDDRPRGPLPNVHTPRSAAAPANHCRNVKQARTSDDAMNHTARDTTRVGVDDCCSTLV